ncbi:hypothetical protein SAMN05444342_4238 [Haladaptatus paucihalophilus DX253]|nr:hypothetical protein SAMN05444342_4238 [Haladaptatus paucihalophilus DX253]
MRQEVGKARPIKTEHVMIQIQKLLDFLAKSIMVRSRLDTMKSLLAQIHQW